MKKELQLKKEEALRIIDGHFSSIKSLLDDTRVRMESDDDSIKTIAMIVGKIIIYYFSDLSSYFNQYNPEKHGNPFEYFEKFYKKGMQ